MMTSRLYLMLLFGCFSLAVSINAAKATEDDFIYVDRMPEIRGEHKRSLVGEDNEGGFQIQQDLYAEDFATAVVETYILKVACGAGREPKAYITAIKYLPKKPATFTVFTLHDIYKQVYVEDQSGKIRLYEDMKSPDMLTLSKRFKPACLAI